MAGGDQWDYMSFWRNTSVQTILNNHVNVKKAPIGGTSAGLAVLGKFVYTAQTGSVSSNEALDNPYDSLIALTDDSLLRIPLFEQLITDSHFYERDRMGRLMSFMGRIQTDYDQVSVRGIGVSENTALCVEENGFATVVGSYEAYFLRSDKYPDICRPNTPLTYMNVTTVRADAGDRATFNMATWTGTNVYTYTLSADDGFLESSQSGGGIYASPTVR
eukprot:TRINITY_DN1948_c0_g1_i2.p1 TRINITY_DN1948_c0_g1~~TRINITY_DN1948_c0_g1_i2.p1  ORF type:complete len:218 (-),score=43.37 TRINITY_DN1948_c0_g1_i2:25-678(-)